MTDVDVAVIGAGPAGLNAAYRLLGSGATIKLFEARDQVGGRTRSAVVAGELVNTGAMFVYVGTESQALCQELGIETVPVHPASFGAHYDGRTVIARDDAELLARLDLPPDATSQLAQVIMDVRAEYATGTGTSGLTEESSRLAQVSFSEQLGALHPAVDAIVRNAVTGGSTADPDHLSAQYALRYFSSYLVRADNHRRYIPGGMQEMCTQLQRRLPPGVLELDTAVTQVERAPDGVVVLHVSTPAGTEELRARYVIFATPGETVAELASWLPERKLAAIAGVPSSPTVTLAIVLDSSDRPHWDDIFFIAVAGRAFNTVMQPRASADVIPSRHCRTTFMCYLSADARAAAPGDDERLVEEWLGDFFAVIPDARGRVLGTLLTRWPRCFAYVAPGRAAVIDAVRAPVDGLFFAGDYTSATAGSHGALAEGARAAREVLDELKVPAPPGPTLFRPDGHRQHTSPESAAGPSQRPPEISVGSAERRSSRITHGPFTPP